MYKCTGTEKMGYVWLSILLQDWVYFYKKPIDETAKISLRRPYSAHRGSSGNCVVLQRGRHWEPFKHIGGRCKNERYKINLRGQCNLRPQPRGHIRASYKDTPLLLSYKFQLISFAMELMQIHSVKPPR